MIDSYTIKEFKPKFISLQDLSGDNLLYLGLFGCLETAQVYYDSSHHKRPAPVSVSIFDNEEEIARLINNFRDSASFWIELSNFWD